MYQAFYSKKYSRSNAFIEMKLTLYLMTNTIYEEKEHFVFGNIFEER